MIGFPNAKINLGLDILDKRPDGFHNISSVFYPVREFFDVLEIIPNGSGSDKFFFSGLQIPGDQKNNLITQALDFIREDHSIPGLNVYLHKVIPMGAGLGGGSSDGSFMLKMLNDMFSLKLSSYNLEKMAIRLGSDCPFFIPNKAVLAEGRGERMKELELDLSGCHIVLAFSSIHISTAEAYQNVVRQKESRISELLGKSPDFDLWRRKLKNGFEPYALSKYPKLVQVKDYLCAQGAVYASMTGSGSAVYGIFQEEPKELKLDSFSFWKGRA